MLFRKAPLPAIPPRFVCWRRGLKIACCSTLRRKTTCRKRPLLSGSLTVSGYAGLPRPSRWISAVMPRWLRPACCSINKRASGCVFSLAAARWTSRCMTENIPWIFRWLFRPPSPRRKGCSRRLGWLKTQVKPGKPPILLSSLMTKRCWTRSNPTLTP